MCGIAGIMGPGGPELIKKMTDAMIHRGPDDSGFYHDQWIALGQRRLSIIDLVSGRQPITNETGDIQLVCNGEIYNSPQIRNKLEASGHNFKTATDVEVILHLYEDFGTNCVKHLQGMFAFAIWDLRNKRLMLARDHLGQKPLFYYHDGQKFAFSSEIKGILATGVVEPQIDMEGLWHYVSLRYLPERYSLFKNIYKLPAATSLTFEDGSISSTRYWDVSFTQKTNDSEEDIIDNLDCLLQDTVKSHLLSDVRVGTFLSGGIDSGTVTAMMAKITGEPIPTFSVGVKEKSFNELPYARMVAQQYGLEAHEQMVEADLVGLIPAMIRHMDEPSDPFGFGVYIVSQLASQEVKVVLGGDGGDENFAGYDRFIGNQLVDYYCLLPRWFRQNIMGKLVSRIPESFAYKSLALKASWFNDMSLFSGGERYAHSLGFLRFTREAKKSLFSTESQKSIIDDDSASKILEYFNAENANDLVDKMLYTDLMTRMPDHLLTIADRMTMAHSLESRSPLIDYKVVEFAAAIPAGMKMKGRTLKYMLRKVASRYLPRELVYRPKQGFGFPLGLWMRTELKTFLTNLFQQSRFVELGVFQHQYIQKLLSEHFSGKVDHNYRLWILINLEIWYRLYFESNSVESMQDFIGSLANRSEMA